ncbi:oligosaccharide flippase family protein [Micromonospora sp. STR1s_5]|nr:oligosaccharide flippase family protein [Micromonospora sp. STR1s_5]
MQPRALVRDGALLYLAYSLKYIFPLIIVPLLARRLGPGEYGLVLASLSLAGLVAMVVEFGFGLSGLRDLSAADPSSRKRRLEAILSAKLVLIVPAALLGAALAYFSPVFAENGVFGLLAVLLGVFLGFNITWYFRAVDRMPTAVSVEASAQLGYFFPVLAFVTGPDSGWLVLAIQAICLGAAQIFCIANIRRTAPIRLKMSEDAVHALVRGAPMFLMTACIAVYTVSGPLILAWLSTPEQVGYFGVAEKLIGAALQLLGPACAVLLPYMAKNLARDPDRAMLVLRYSLLTLVAGAAIGTTGTMLVGRTVLAWLLGPGYEASAEVLVVLSAVLPLSVALQCISMLLLFPLGRDRTVTAVALSGGLAYLVFALLLVPSQGALGLAYSRIAAEIVLLGVSVVITTKTRDVPVWRRAQPS